MLAKRKQLNDEGFTIIEVLIVLAIAGLILLIVFLAVPALQRNSRNTQRKNDASSLSSAVAEFVDNNDGKLPAVSDKDAIANNWKPGYYDKGTGNANISVVLGTGSAAPSAVTSTEKVTIATYATCNGTDPAVGTPRSVAVLYAVELNGGGSKGQCISAN